MKKDYYDILGISSKATPEEIRKAYRINAIKYHPDKNFGDASYSQKFIEIKEAYDTLIDPEKREQFDLQYQAFVNSNLASETAYRTTRHERKKREKDEEEKFRYDPYRPFYSSLDREQQETPQFEPQKTPWGEQTKGKFIFFSLPKRIGKLISGWSTLLTTTKKITRTSLFILVIQSCYISIPVFGIIAALIWNHWYYNLKDTGATKSIGITYGILISLIVWIKYISRINEVKFYHSNFFIGINGFAIYSCAGTTKYIWRKLEVDFNDVTDFVSLTTVNKFNFNYTNTDYRFMWINADSKKVVYETKGTFHDENSNPDKILWADYWLNVEAEKYWTVYLLDNLEKTLQDKGYITFRIYLFESSIHVPYIQLGIGYITFLLKEKETTYKFNEIKKMYTKGNDLYIEHKNFQKTFFFLESGNKNYIPLLNLSNRSFFLKALEILLGYSLT